MTATGSPAASEGADVRRLAGSPGVGAEEEGSAVSGSGRLI